MVKIDLPDVGKKLDNLIKETKTTTVQPYNNVPIEDIRNTGETDILFVISLERGCQEEAE